jgi:predicted porin
MRKKSLFVFFALSGVYATASAQSSVTLYGVVDGGIGYTSGERVAQSVGSAGHPVVYTNGSAFAFTGGTMNGSRWGVMGSEDLGGGMSTVFQVESGFNIGTGVLGPNSLAFGRQAFVGLSSTQYGRITMGRQYDPTVDLVGPIGPTSFLTGMAAHPGDLDNIDNQSRENNSIKYTSPLFGGLRFSGLYGIGGKPGSIANQSTWSIGAQYAGGQFAIAGAYLQANNNNGPTGGTWAGAYDGTFNSSVTEGFASSKSLQLIDAAATYLIGKTTLGVSWGNTQYQGGAYSLFQGKVTFNSVGATVVYQATPAFRFGGGYNYTRGSSLQGASAPTYNQFTLSSFYSLSKQTVFYALVGYQKASGKTLDPYGNLVNATASVGDCANGISSATNKQALVRIGIRKNF